MIDPVEAFIALLKSDTDLRALVQGQTQVRIYGAPPGLGEDAYNTDTGIPYQSLVVQQNDVKMQTNIPVCYPMFYLIAYGQEGYETQEVLTKVYNVLYHTDGERKGSLKCNIMIDDRWFMYRAEIQIGSPIIEQQSQWPVAYATVRAKFDSLRGA